MYASKYVTYIYIYYTQRKDLLLQSYRYDLLFWYRFDVSFCWPIIVFVSAFFPSLFQVKINTCVCWIERRDIITSMLKKGFRVLRFRSGVMCQDISLSEWLGLNAYPHRPIQGLTSSMGCNMNSPKHQEFVAASASADQLFCALYFAYTTKPLSPPKTSSRCFRKSEILRRTLALMCANK